MIDKPTSVDYKIRRCNQLNRQRNSFSKKVIFHHQYDSIYTLGSNLANMYKLPNVHKKCRQTSKFPSCLNSRYPNIKVTVEYPNYNHLSYLDCNVTLNQDNLSTSIYIKNIHCPWH